MLSDRGCCPFERPLGLGESQSAGWSAEAACRRGTNEGEAECLRVVEAGGTTLTAHKMGRYRTGQSKKKSSEASIGSLHSSAWGEAFCRSHDSPSQLKFGLMDNRKHLETSGPFTGLWVRTARALCNAGYKSREKVRADIQRGALHPYISIFDYGKKADAEVRAWLGLKSWGESWGKTPRIVSRKGSVENKADFPG